MGYTIMGILVSGVVLSIGEIEVIVHQICSGQLVFMTDGDLERPRSPSGGILRPAASLSTLLFPLPGLERRYHT